MHSDVDCRALYNSQDTVATKISIDGGMDKEYVVLIYNGMLLNRKKNCKWILYRLRHQGSPEMNLLMAYYVFPFFISCRIQFANILFLVLAFMP